MTWYSVWTKVGRLVTGPMDPSTVALAVRCGQFVGNPARDVRSAGTDPDPVGDVVVARLDMLAENVLVSTA